MKPPPILGLLFLSKRANQLLEERLGPIGLTRTQARVLAVLSHNEGLTATDLLPHAAVEPASMTRLLQGLERDGLIEKQPHPADRRATILCITDEGRKTQKKARAILEATNDDLFRTLSKEETEELQRLFGLLSDRLGELGVH